MPRRSPGRTALASRRPHASKVGEPLRAWLEKQVASVALRSYAEAIVDSLTSGLAVLDSDLVPVSANGAFRGVVGLSDDHPLDRPLDRLLPLPELVTAARRSLETLQPRHNLLFERVDPRGRRLLRVNLTPARGAGPGACLVLAIEDVTDLKILRLAAARSEELFRATFEQAAVGIAHLDAQACCMRVNHRLAEITALTPQDLVGASLLDLLAEGERIRVERGLRELRDGRRPLVSGEHRLERRDGDERWALITLSLVRNPQGEPDYYIAVVEDVTDLRSTRDALQTTQEQFRHAQKLEAVGRLAGGVAHDFNNILTAILGYANLLVERGGNDPTLRDYAAEIRDAAGRAAGLTRQLLAFSRRQVLQPCVLDLNEAVREVERMLRRVIGEDVSLRIELAPALGAVWADRGQLEQVLLNLAVNGRDAMPDGGTLTIATRECEIAAPTRLDEQEIPPGRYILLSVTDDGVGMDSGTRQRAFEPFFTTKQPSHGTGLGLSTVHGIVRQSGGFVWIESQPRAGTAVRILLPRQEREPERPAGPVADPGGAPGHGTILLVEDDPGVRGLAHKLLTGAGYAVLVAGDPLAAVDHLRGHPGAIDLLLSDVVMPGLDGRELARLLRAERPGLRVLFMSGYAEDVIGQHGVLEPGIDLLHKPFAPAALLAAVRAALDTPARA